MLLGVEGIGKSSWAASAPKPIFMGNEETYELDIDRFPPPIQWEDCKEQLDWFIKQKTEHKTFVVDTVDSIQKLLHNYVLRTSKNKTRAMAQAHGGYGAGYDIAEKEFLDFREKLKTLRDKKGMNIILLCHVKKSQVTDPIMGLQYDTFETNLHNKEQGVFTDWVSAVLFANYVHHKAEMDNTQKKFALGEGDRTILTERRPGHIGKNRYELPYELPMPKENPIGPFLKYYERFYAGEGRSAEEIEKSIKGLASNLEGQDIHAKIMQSLEKVKGNKEKLEALEGRVKERINES